ncbi:hypothetical protein P175DRAFT_0100324 [Aspergillus ochraceoroseus IBT 24754]|uniref:Uncharacterized protein n=1 Tax=Aspergillus ochraceoroseus IBT 24754 TaxID=1392256 RepID=A0A2T5LLQ2_9EURO|nr:uncharacterized protein P175DRAFT_0100324 [Aspergillus ochraceoroseus IBT 24754]PTU17199.1 hypothetical protein P175DRAFT_0100324 [Aspergillus ochraceoroseus IBT 24754]
MVVNENETPKHPTFSGLRQALSTDINTAFSAPYSRISSYQNLTHKSLNHYLIQSLSTSSLFKKPLSTANQDVSLLLQLLFWRLQLLLLRLLQRKSLSPGSGKAFDSTKLPSCRVVFCPCYTSPLLRIYSALNTTHTSFPDPSCRPQRCDQGAS